MKTITVKSKRLPWSLWDYRVEINDIYLGKLKRNQENTFNVPHNIHEGELKLTINQGYFRVSPAYVLSNKEKESVSVSTNQIYIAYMLMFIMLFPLISQIKNQNLLTLLLIVIPVLYFILGLTVVSRFILSIKQI